MSLPLPIKDSFKIEALIFNYANLKSKFNDSKSITRKKSLRTHKIKNSVFTKSHENIALKLFNELPNELKVLNCSSKTLKSKITSWCEKLNCLNKDVYLRRLYEINSANMRFIVVINMLCIYNNTLSIYN